MDIRFDTKYVDKYVSEEDIEKTIESFSCTISSCLNGSLGLQNALGWKNVSDNTSELYAYKKIAEEIRSEDGVLLVVGVGGSNRSAQALIEGLHENNGRIIYLGNNFSVKYVKDTLDSLKDRSVFVDIIAKDFHTVEPGIAFRYLREYLKNRYGNDYNRRVILTGSYGEEQLYTIAEKEGFRFFEFPQKVGGRFSAFTSVSLLPMAVAGLDVDLFVQSAIDCQNELENMPLKENPSVRYAVVRYLLQKKGFLVENLAYFEPYLEYFARWWLQLHGESEGKTESAVLPYMTSFSEDLHAIGQYIQQGRRFIAETFLNMRFADDFKIPSTDFDDGFSYLDGKNFSAINTAVYNGTLKAHYDGGIPVMQFVCGAPSERTLAEIMYVNMLSTYLSSALIGVEPFDQPGVEGYKKNMYKELGK